MIVRQFTCSRFQIKRPNWKMIVLKLRGFGREAWCPTPALKIYLTHPNDLRRAFQHNREHPFFHDLRNGNCDFLFPDDQGDAFRLTFPNLLGA